ELADTGHKLAMLSLFGQSLDSFALSDDERQVRIWCCSGLELCCRCLNISTLPAAILYAKNVDRHGRFTRLNDDFLTDCAVLLAAGDNFARHQVQRFARRVEYHELVDFGAGRTK